MKTYVGTKMIMARPMNRQEYNDYRGWKLPADEDGSDEGYLVEYVDGGQSNHPDHTGYISWSPADVFHRAYKGSGEMSFSQALEIVKTGGRVARSGWNGKGMWLELQVPDHYSKMTLPYIYMKTADNHQVPWLANQTDILAEDWEVISNG